jgi:hypothetical protein
MKYSISEKYDLDKYQVDDPLKLQEEIFANIREFLDGLQIPRGGYALGERSEGYGELSLYYDDGMWVVCSAERGEILNPAFFASPWDAARYLTWEVIHANLDKVKNFPFLRFNLKL